MSTNEIATVTRQYHERIEAILSEAELACYTSYQQRLQSAIMEHDNAPIAPSADEQAALDRIAADETAAALRKQLDVLLRIETLPQ